MKKVRIFGATVIGGAVRYPVEGDLSVSDDEADRIVENKQGEIVEDDNDDPSSIAKLTVDQLRELAAREGVDLGTATKKAELVAAIEQHRAGKADA